MDFVLRSGDQAIFDTTFGSATVFAPPGIITGSSRSKVDGAIVCVAGDEASVTVTAGYSTMSHSIPETELLTIDALAADQMATKAKGTRLAVLLRGSRFHARLQVTKPAQTPELVPDPVLGYAGGGVFTTANAKVQAT